VPERGILKLGFEPFEVIEMLPVALPEFCGAKIALNVKL